MNRAAHFKQLSTLVIALCIAISAAGVFTAQAGHGARATQDTTSSNPHPVLAPLNPKFVKYEEDVARGKAVEHTPNGRALGAVPPTVDLSSARAAAVQASVTVPSAFDLRSTNKVTSVKDQGSCGACWAFATMGSLESSLLPSTSKDFSENNLNRMHGQDYQCCAGANIQTAAAYLSRWNGPGLESADPYVGTACAGASTIPANMHTQRVEMLPPLPSPNKAVADYNLIKQYVYTKGAVYTTFYWDASQYNVAHAAYRYSGSFDYNNHAVTIVGWDDSYPVSNFNTRPPLPGALLIKNSWGTTWGQSGYFWISYYDVSVGTGDNGFFSAEPTTNYKTVYQYDPLGWHGSLGYPGTTTAWGANVFTVARTEQLSAVSFYATTGGAQYQIYVHVDPTQGPSGGTTYLGPSGLLSVPGYYTVKLSTPVPLVAGHKFSVIVKMKGGAYPLAMEGSTYPTSRATALSGQSYSSSSGNEGTWRDITTDYSNSNLCIKAFTTAGPLPTTFSITTSTPTPTSNVAFTLSGTLKTGAITLTNQPIHLERRTNTGGTWSAWANVAGTYKYTSGTGVIKLAQTVSTAGSYQYRWHYNGTTTYKPAYSSAINETVKKPTSVAITNSTAPKYNVAFTLSGTLKSGTTGLVGYSIHLERKVGTGSWANVDGTTKTTTTGGAIPSVSQTMTTHGAYSYRWHFTGTGTYQAGYSPIKTFTV